MIDLQDKEKKLANEVYQDFLERQTLRKPLERIWQLNLLFYRGEQYKMISRCGEIEDVKQGYIWQTRRVYNHIAPIIETRLSKLGKITPTLYAKSATLDESDIKNAQLSTQILKAVFDEIGIEKIQAEVNMWSEVCGTGFYQVLWNNENLGNVKICAISPFEIYPKTLIGEDITEQESIIHAKIVPVSEIFSTYSVRLPGKKLADFTSGTSICDSELLIERYIKPNKNHPLGSLTIVAGGKVLYDGNLPYNNASCRTYPFIKQLSSATCGEFFGHSVIERLIPVQRAYNAVKCRRHEFLNRICMGVVAVEDGSCDIESLVQDGLAPGKVIVYHQGTTPPQMLTLGTVPNELLAEEERLEKEFYTISGTGEVTQNLSNFNGVTSATGLKLLIEQDDVRLCSTYKYARQSLKAVGKMVLKLYKQFSSQTRLLHVGGDNGEKSCLYFKSSDICECDIVLDSESELNMTATEKRASLLELVDKKIITKDSVVSNEILQTILDTLGLPTLSVN